MLVVDLRIKVNCITDWGVGPSTVLTTKAILFEIEPQMKDIGTTSKAISDNQ